MKTIRMYNTGDGVRFTNELAADAVKRGEGCYVPKSYWKAQRKALDTHGTGKVPYEIGSKLWVKGL